MGHFTAVSFFSGMGGIDLAFAAAGFDIVAQIENDPFCQQVLTKHKAAYWPNAKLWGDIHHVRKHHLETADVFFGGFPCQDISVAGQSVGIQRGNRSGLWFEFARLIGELRPRVVLLENVANITDAGMGGTIVTGDLAEMGYDCLWLPLQAAEFGAPHRRERWFCVAYRRSLRRQGTRTRHTGVTRNGTVRHFNAEGQQSFMRLSQVVKLWPTPHARDYRHGDKPDSGNYRRKKELGFTIDLNSQVLGIPGEPEEKLQLNPDWEELLMGFPVGWTDISGLQDQTNRSTTTSRPASPPAATDAPAA